MCNDNHTHAATPVTEEAVEETVATPAATPAEEGTTANPPASAEEAVSVSEETEATTVEE